MISCIYIQEPNKIKNLKVGPNRVEVIFVAYYTTKEVSMQLTTQKELNSHD